MPRVTSGSTRLQLSGILSQMIKDLWHEVDELPPYSTEVKNEWCHISTPHVCLHGMKRDNFTCTFYLVFTHPHLVSWLRVSRSIPILPLFASIGMW